MEQTASGSTERPHGLVDILVNNAGAVDKGTMLDSSVESAEGAIALDLVAPIVLTRLSAS